MEREATVTVYVEPGRWSEGDQLAAMVHGQHLVVRLERCTSTAASGYGPEGWSATALGRGNHQSNPQAYGPLSKTPESWRDGSFRRESADVIDAEVIDEDEPEGQAEVKYSHADDDTGVDVATVAGTPVSAALRYEGQEAILKAMGVELEDFRDEHVEGEGGRHVITMAGWEELGDKVREYHHRERDFEWFTLVAAHIGQRPQSFDHAKAILLRTGHRLGTLERSEGLEQLRQGIDLDTTGARDKLEPPTPDEPDEEAVQHDATGAARTLRGVFGISEGQAEAQAAFQRGMEPMYAKLAQLAQGQGRELLQRLNCAGPCPKCGTTSGEASQYTDGGQLWLLKYLDVADVIARQCVVCGYTVLELPEDAA